MKTTCVLTFSVDNALTPFSVGKYNRFLIDRRSSCMRQMRPKVTILAHTGLLMKALKTALRHQKASLLTGAVRPCQILAWQVYTLSAGRGAVSAIEQDGVISNKWIERDNRFV